MQGVINKATVSVIGDIELDEDELEVLGLPPDFTVYSRLKEEEFMVETEMAMTKLRWEKRKILEEQIEGDIEISDKEREEMEVAEAKSRTPLLNHSVCCVFRVTNFHGVMYVTTQRSSVSTLRDSAGRGGHSTGSSSSLELWRKRKYSDS